MRTQILPLSDDAKRARRRQYPRWRPDWVVEVRVTYANGAEDDYAGLIARDLAHARHLAAFNLWDARQTAGVNRTRVVAWSVTLTEG